MRPSHLLALLLLLLPGLAVAAPFRSPPPRPATVRWEPGRQENVLVVKLSEGLRVENGRVVAGPGDLSALNRLLAGARPLFARDPQALRAERAAIDPQRRLADLTLYLQLQLGSRSEAEARGTALLRDPRVETAYFAFAPVQPPADIEPTTPDLTATQAYTGPPPDGLGFAEARSWPGGAGQGVTIADIEYDWNPNHEDLEAVPGPFAWGWDSGNYPCHGTMVLGILIAGDNGYGMTGLVPDASMLMISPYSAPGSEFYSIAAAIDAAASLLEPGDVILIEQQVFANGSYAPAEAEVASFDAIALAVARGIAVVEPSGNGGQDLDDPSWEGWFDRNLRDSGAILVGGGAPPGGLAEPRAWTGGSSYGSRIDLQGWYDGIATTTYSPAIDPYCAQPDLFFPEDDGDQGYTSLFSGTSGASPLITAVVAAAQAIALQTRGTPWAPMDLRAALISTGTPQAGEQHIGPQPDLRTFLRTWGVK